MEYLKLFEDFKDSNIVNIIDDVMLTFIDMGFEEIHGVPNRLNKNMKIFKNYKRKSSLYNIIQINGYIENGKVILINLDPKNMYDERDSDIANEFISSMETISSAASEKIHFSFTNYDYEKILIYIPK